MFYFRYYIYKFLKPWMRPMSPETAIKGHFTALALYVLFASNCAFGGYYYYKTLNVEDDDEDDRKNESEMDRLKRKAAFYNSDCPQIKRVDLWKGEVEIIDFDLKAYQEEQRLKKLAKLEEQKKVAMI